MLGIIGFSGENGGIHWFFSGENGGNHWFFLVKMVGIIGFSGENGGNHWFFLVKMVGIIGFFVGEGTCNEEQYENHFISVLILKDRTNGLFPLAWPRVLPFDLLLYPNEPRFELLVVPARVGLFLVSTRPPNNPNQ